MDHTAVLNRRRYEPLWAVRGVERQHRRAVQQVVEVDIRLHADSFSQPYAFADPQVDSGIPILKKRLRDDQWNRGGTSAARQIATERRRDDRIGRRVAFTRAALEAWIQALQSGGTR